MERAVWLGDGVSGCLINRRSVQLCHTRSGKVQNIMGWHNLGELLIRHRLPFQAAFCAHHPRQPENINNTSRVYGFATHAVSHTTALSRLPNPSQMFNAATLSPTSSRTQLSLFREKACACSTTRIARLVRTRRKKNAERGKSAKQTCTSGSPFFCLLFFGEAKKSKCPVGTRRMVKATPQTNHKAPIHFQAAPIYQPPTRKPPCTTNSSPSP